MHQAVSIYHYFYSLQVMPRNGHERKTFDMLPKDILLIVASLISAGQQRYHQSLVHHGVLPINDHIHSIHKRYFAQVSLPAASLFRSANRSRVISSSRVAKAVSNFSASLMAD